MPNSIPEHQIANFLRDDTKSLRLDNLPTDHDTNRFCPICHLPYVEPPNEYVHPQHPRDDEEYAIQIQHSSGCRHIFGRVCLERHMRGGNPWSHTCPLCRTEWFPAPNATRRHMIEDIERTLIALSALELVGEQEAGVGSG